MKNYALVLLAAFFFVNNAGAGAFSAKKIGTLKRGGTDRDKDERKLEPKDTSDWADLTEVSLTGGPKEFKKGGFTIETGPECKDCGDAARYLVTVRRKNGLVDGLGGKPLGYVSVTPDERYLLAEKRPIIDTNTWKEVPGSLEWIRSRIYEGPARYSARAKRLLFWETPCVADCQGQSDILWEVQLP